MSLRRLYADVTGLTGIQSVSVNHSHSAATSTATITCEGVSSGVGDNVEVDLGYYDDHDVIFNGYIKQIERKVRDDLYTVTAQDVLIRAIDYFVVSEDPDNVFTRDHIEAGQLIKDVLGLAGLSSFDFDETDFTLGINTKAEVNLVSAYDYSKMIADIIAYSIWAEPDGVIRLKGRKPHFVGPHDPCLDQVGITEDIVMSGVMLVDLQSSYNRNERDLRNRVVVYGNNPLSAEAKSSTSYDPITDGMIAVLPAGFYKSMAIATPILDEQSFVTKTANYNLKLYNRLGVQFQATVEGDHRLIARNCINVENPIIFPGQTLPFYIYASDHQWGTGGYTVNLELRK